MLGRPLAPLKGSGPATPADVDVPVTGQPVATAPQANCVGLAGDPGSSISSSASELTDELAIKRLVTAVFRTIVRLAAGMVCPDGVGMPPVHFSTMSPTNSVNPSALTVGVAGTLAEQAKSAAPAAGGRNDQIASTDRMPMCLK